MRRSTRPSTAPSAAANNPPTAFTLNGTACSIGNSTNTPPTVSLTVRRRTRICIRRTVSFTANASDNGGVAHVVFRVDGNLVTTDTTSP